MKLTKGKKAARCGFFQSSRLFLHLTKHEFYITGCLNDSSFQQSKLEALNMYTSKVIKLTKVALYLQQVSIGIPMVPMKFDFCITTDEFKSNSFCIERQK